MSRSAADATRFTATGPYASSKPGAPAYKLPDFMSNSGNNSNANPSQGPGGQPETPKQKVERLRAQAKAARMAQSSSGFDRFLGAGRDLANKAHKVTVYSLIAASGMFPFVSRSRLNEGQLLIEIKASVVSSRSTPSSP